MLTPIIWLLRKAISNDLATLQAGQKPQQGLGCPAFMQQRPSANPLLAPTYPVNLPWSATGLAGLLDKPTPAYPSVIHELRPIPPTYFRITGITRDSTGAVLGSCTVNWFNTADGSKIDSTTSDANGLYEFRTAGQPPNAYYLVAYKAGSPDVGGTTVNTLVGT